MKTLRLAQVIIPAKHSCGALRPDVLRDTLARIKARFGGFTVIEALGADPTIQDAVKRGDGTEDVRVVQVAIADAAEDWQDFRRVAEDVRTALAQECVMVTWPCGRVSFIGDETSFVPVEAREVESRDSARDPGETCYEYNRGRRTTERSDADVRAFHGERVRARAEASRPWEG